MSDTSNTQWYASWFDTPWYHVLYQHRDYQEAQFFLDKLITHLAPKAQAQVLDLACGRGRHARYLSEKDLCVTGVDLSENSIQFAKQFEKENLHFFEHDMREVFRPEGFDFVLNLFTSFGYFDSTEENLSVILAAAKSLKPNGIFVLDFMNTPKVLRQLVPEESKTLDGITFQIKRYLEDGTLVKSIDFEAEGQPHHYEERVRAISKTSFEGALSRAGLRIKAVFGDYALNAYDAEHSDRMLFIAEKIPA